MQQQIDERSLKVLAQFTSELLAATERRAPTFSWPRWFAEMSGVSLDNPAFADGRHLKKGASDHEAA